MRPMVLLVLVSLISGCASSIDFGPEASPALVAASLPPDDREVRAHGWCVAYLGVRITKIHGTASTVVLGTCAVTDKAFVLMQWDPGQGKLYPIKRILIADILAIEREGPGRARPLIVQSGPYTFDTFEMRSSVINADHAMNDHVAELLLEQRNDGEN